MNPKRFFVELKRRNVYRAAVLYGMSAWLLAQITTQIFPFFNVPNSAVRFVIIALALGFPIAMVLAWVYELTPEGRALLLSTVKSVDCQSWMKCDACSG